MRASVAFDAALRAKRKTVQPIALMDIERAAKACTSLAQFAREAADNAEMAWSRLEQSGVLFEAVRHARKNGLELPSTDILESVRTLRAYAGAILLFVGSLRPPHVRAAERDSTEQIPAVDATASVS